MTDLTPQSAVASATNALIPPRPKLRGWLHAGTFPLAFAGGIVLICLAPTTGTAVACSVFAVSSWLLFGVSGIYHTKTWSPKWKAVLRRFDHTNIFLIIAGTYTPVSVTLLSRAEARLLLVLVWTGAAVGIGFRMFWLSAPRWVYVPCYIALGWAALFFLPQLERTGGLTVVVLIIVGGVLYSIGAVIYALKKPDLSPKWFGFHELFHALTIAAFGCHYTAVAISVAHFRAGH
nr:hemolysin III family protein [Actinospica robiniae]